jgi:2-dehydropantoate 2-reductase
MAMRIAVLGAGANGAAIGADLTRAGLDVTLIEQWPAHVEAMRSSGIRVVTPSFTGNGDETVTTAVTAVHLCDVATLREPFDLVFVLVKAYDTRWACELIKPLLAHDGIVVGLQNGMALDDIADVVGSSRTLGAVIEVSSNMFEPGVVNRQSPRDRSWFALGSFDASTVGREDAVAAVLRHAGTVEISDDIRSSKWMKLVVNAAELAPSAILDLPLADAVRVPGMHAFMLATGVEAATAAVASGSRLRPIFGLEGIDLASPTALVSTLFDAVLNDYTLPDTRTTVLQDWMKSRRSEVNEINGLVVDELARHNIPAPYNAVVVDIAHRIESGDLRAHPDNVALLLDGVAP